MSQSMTPEWDRGYAFAKGEDRERLAALEVVAEEARFLHQTCLGGFTRCSRCGNEDTSADFDFVASTGEALAKLDALKRPSDEELRRAQEMVRRWGSQPMTDGRASE